MNETAMETLPKYYVKLLGDIRDILHRVQVVAAIEVQRTRWLIGDRVKQLSDSDSFPEGRPSKNRIFSTLTKLAEDLREDYPLLTRPRLSECVTFRKIVGDNFDIWVKGQLAVAGVVRRDVNCYIIPSYRDPEKAALSAKKNYEAGERKAEKEKKAFAEAVNKAAKDIDIRDASQCIEALTNKLLEGFEFRETDVLALKILAEEIRKRYPEE